MEISPDDIQDCNEAVESFSDMFTEWCKNNADKKPEIIVTSICAVFVGFARPLLSREQMINVVNHQLDCYRDFINRMDNEKKEK